LAALEHRTATPASRLTDAPLTRVLDGKVWSPTNHDGKYLGEVGLREMLEGSRNIPAIHLAESVGMQRLQGFYAKAGLSKATSLPAAALGAFAVTPLQLAGAYTAFVSDGRAWEPQIIGVLTAADGEEVHRLEPRFTRLADPRRAAQVNHMLAGVVEQGTGARAARYGVAQPAAGKTGTTDAYRDAWFVGQTPDLVVAVWVGRDRGTLGLSGSRAALPTWARFVRASGTNRGAFEVPAGLTSVELCVADSQPPCPGCDRVEDELFPAGEEPVANCSPVPAAFSEFGERLGALFKRRDAPVQGAAKPASKSKKARRKQKEP
jgi:penicillin-binding protein 1B